MIYEGTNGIQALDFLGRKIAKDGGQTLIRMVTLMKKSQWKDASQQKNLDEVLALLDKANAYLLENMADSTIMTAIASSYLKLFALVIQYWLLGEVGSDEPALIGFYEDVILADAHLYYKQIMAGSSHMHRHEGFNQILQRAKKS